MPIPPCPVLPATHALLWRAHLTDIHQHIRRFILKRCVTLSPSMIALCYTCKRHGILVYYVAAGFFASSRGSLERIQNLEQFEDAVTHPTHGQTKPNGPPARQHRPTNHPIPIFIFTCKIKRKMCSSSGLTFRGREYPMLSIPQP